MFNNPNDDSDVEIVEIPTNDVFTYTGQVKVVKKDANEEDKVLQGAKFELYRSDDKTCGNGDEVKLTVDGHSDWTTDEQGTFLIKGLHVTNIEDSDKPIDKTYCLKEVEAPTGYATPQGSDAWTDFKISVDQKKDELGQKVVEGSTITNASKEIKNVKRDTPNLPMTGGAGVGILAAIGAAIIGAGAWFARRNSAKA
ncbi:fimbrial assembly protein [Corynebacterium diphtheriae]|nr:fimbrial assembly protein [Corynebacterium diphtheriae]